MGCSLRISVVGRYCHHLGLLLGRRGRRIDPPPSWLFEIADRLLGHAAHCQIVAVVPCGATDSIDVVVHRAFVVLPELHKERCGETGTGEHRVAALAGPRFAVIGALDDRGIVGALHEVAVLGRAGMLADRHVEHAVHADQAIGFPRVVMIVVAGPSISIHGIDEADPMFRRHAFDAKEGEVAVVALVDAGAVVRRAVNMVIITLAFKTVHVSP